MIPEIDAAVLQSYLQGLAILSVTTFGLSIALIPWLVSLLPENYFLFAPKKSRAEGKSIRLAALILLLIRNILGLLLLLAGIAMLFLPGQGIITMIIGLVVMSFPFKKQVVQGLSRYPAVRKSLDWIRTKTGKKQFLWP
jgi:hypothetical protein